MRNVLKMCAPLLMPAYLTGLVYSASENRRDLVRDFEQSGYTLRGGGRIEFDVGGTSKPKIASGIFVYTREGQSIGYIDGVHGDIFKFLTLRGGQRFVLENPDSKAEEIAKKRSRVIKAFETKDSRSL